MAKLLMSNIEKANQIQQNIKACLTRYEQLPQWQGTSPWNTNPKKKLSMQKGHFNF